MQATQEHFPTYESFFRDMIAKTWGEAQAERFEQKPFDYQPPDAVLTILNVGPPVTPSNQEKTG